MIKTAFFIFLIVIISYTGLSDIKKVKTNFEILDSLVSGYVEYLNDNLNIKDTLKVIITRHPAEWLFRKHLAEKRGNRILIISNDSLLGTLSDKVEIWINKLLVNFSYDESEYGTIIRTSAIEVSTGVTQPDGVVTSLPFYQKELIDSLSEDEYEFVQNSQYNFAKGILPEQEKSFFKRIVEPVIVITAAATTVLLFFTVRSK